mgnify:CR=1 FL=1
MDKYVCKVATVDEMNNKWDYEINHATKNKENWIIWKKENIESYTRKVAERIADFIFGNL